MSYPVLTLGILRRINRMTRIETDRLIVRNFTVNDWQALYLMIAQYQASEYAAYDQPWPTSPEEIKGATEWFTGGDSYLAACLKDTGQLIGFVALNPEDSAEGRAFNLGYVFNADYHGKGYATEACRAVLERAFGQLQAQKVVTGTAAANQPSCRLLHRLGFQKISERTVSFRTGANGEPVEFLGYSYNLSKEAWEGT
jgi:ribosomal-protein-alanine N-acetyltransferase